MFVRCAGADSIEAYVRDPGRVIHIAFIRHLKDVAASGINGMVDVELNMPPSLQLSSVCHCRFRAWHCGTSWPAQPHRWEGLKG